MQRGFAFPLLLLGVVIIISGYFFISTKEKSAPVVSPVKETNINTYSSISLNFRFDYSPELNIKEDSEEEFNKRGNGDFRKNFRGYVGYEPGKFLRAVAVLDNLNSFELNPFTVWVFDNPDNLSIDRWYDKYWYYPFVWGDFTTSGKMKLAPKEGSVVVDYQPGSPTFIYLSKNKNIYLLRVIGEEGNKILATFKFLKN